jgi:hypothetical protein
VGLAELHPCASVPDWGKISGSGAYVCGEYAVTEDPETGDAARWWRAYQLADAGRDDELRRHADEGDEHARRALASWLAERARYAEAIEVIRPLAATGEHYAVLRLDRWLADAGHTEELRRRAAHGDDRAWEELASWLASSHQLDELAGLARAAAARRPEALARWLAQQGDMYVHRIGADAGDTESQRRLAMWRARRGHTE